MKKSNIIEMEQRGGVFVPSKLVRDTVKPSLRKGQRAVDRQLSEPQQIGKILEGMVTDFFRMIRREMMK
jgi:hypothetical protein